MHPSAEGSNHPPAVLWVLLALPDGPWHVHRCWLLSTQLGRAGRDPSCQPGFEQDSSSLAQSLPLSYPWACPWAAGRGCLHTPAANSCPGASKTLPRVAPWLTADVAVAFQQPSRPSRTQLLHLCRVLHPWWKPHGQCGMATCATQGTGEQEHGQCCQGVLPAVNQTEAGQPGSSALWAVQCPVSGLSITQGKKCRKGVEKK